MRITDCAASVHCQIAVHWLGIGEYAAFSWTCKLLSQNLKPTRAAFLRFLHKEIRRRLDELFALDAASLMQFETCNAVIAGSAILALANREYWLPEDVDVWVSDRNYDDVFRSVANRKNLAFTAECKHDQEWFDEYQRSTTFTLCKTPRPAVRPLQLCHLHQPPHETGWYIVNRFDADFLRLFFSGEKLHVLDLRAIAERRPMRWYASFERKKKYSNRGFKPKLFDASKSSRYIRATMCALLFAMWLNRPLRKFVGQFVGATLFWMGLVYLCTVIP